MATPKLPNGIQLTVLDETYRNDPYPILREIQTQKAVHHNNELGQYLYTRYDDVRNILRDKEMWTDPRKGAPGSFIYEILGGAEQDKEPSMLLMDEPDHRRLRSLVNKPFTPAQVEKWRQRTRHIVHRTLDKITTSRFDLIAEFAGPIPTVVIAEMLGIDASRHDDFKHWSDAAVKTAFNAFPEADELDQGNAAQAALNDFFKNQIQLRRQQLGDDLISDMLRAEEQGSKLTDDEIISQCNLLLIAGNVTTTDLIGNGIKALLDHPEQLKKLRHKPELINNTVEEILRFDPPVNQSGRIANRTYEVNGCPVGRGQSLATSLAAANRDPNAYQHPDSFDIEREDSHHQSFGGGRHTCLGAHLARLEAQEAILGLLDRFPNLAHAQQGYRYANIPGFRGLAEFWLQN